MNDHYRLRAELQAAEEEHGRFRGCCRHALVADDADEEVRRLYFDWLAALVMRGGQVSGKQRGQLQLLLHSLGLNAPEDSLTNRLEAARQLEWRQVQQLSQQLQEQLLQQWQEELQEQEANQEGLAQKLELLKGALLFDCMVLAGTADVSGVSGGRSADWLMQLRSESGLCEERVLCLQFWAKKLLGEAVDFPKESVLRRYGESICYPMRCVIERVEYGVGDFAVMGSVVMHVTAVGKAAGSPEEYEREYRSLPVEVQDGRMELIRRRRAEQDRLPDNMPDRVEVV